MKFTVLVEAELEAAETAAWYEDRREGLGTAFLEEVAAGLAKIAQDPNSFAHLESYAGPHDVRRYVLRRFPFLIVFHCRADETLVAAITHARRQPLYWLDRLS